MTSTLRAIGLSARKGHYAVKFYYRNTEGFRDDKMPTWEVPAQSWDHMQNIVAAVICVERASEMAKVIDQF